MNALKRQLSFLSGRLAMMLPRTRKHKVIAVFSVSFLLVVSFFAVEPVGAQTFTTIGNGLLWGMTQGLLALARLALSVAVFFLQFFIEIAAYNNFIDAPPVVVGWLMVRDVANMFFVVAMLVIAFGTILGIEQYEWKKTLIKLILAAIFINFSKLILQLIIDIAHVFTTTFLNAIVATAGGNLINMLKMDSVLQMTGRDLNFLGADANAGEDLRLDLFVAGAMALFFATVTMALIGYYVLLMLIRMVVLWVLIILSPIFFILQVLPATKSRADEYWKEFTHHVLVAPMAVFFLWLTFATLGGGNIANDINLQVSATGASQIAQLPNNPSVSLVEASTWENFASFLIAIGFLYVGIDQIQKLNVKGGSLVSGAFDFGKKVATIATGYAAGRWLYERGTDLGGKGVKGALYHLPVVGGKKWETRGKIVGKAVQDWYYAKGYALSKKGEEMRIEAQDKQAKLQEVNKKISQAKPEDRAPLEAQKQTLESDIAGLEAGMEQERAGGLLGYTARKGIQLEKQLAKTERKADTQRKILWKRIGSEAGGVLLKTKLGGLLDKDFEVGIGAGTKGIFGVLGDRFRKDEDLAKTVYGEKGIYAMDRVERGWLQAEEVRSKAKDEEFEGLGKRQGFERARLKFDVNTGKLTYQIKKGSMQDQIMAHNIGKEIHEGAIDKFYSKSRIDAMARNAKAPTGDSYQDMTRMKAQAEVFKGTMEKLDSGIKGDELKDIFKEGRRQNFRMADLERAMEAIDKGEKFDVTGFEAANDEITQLQGQLTGALPGEEAAIQQRIDDKKREVKMQMRDEISNLKQGMGYSFTAATSVSKEKEEGKQAEHNFLMDEAEQREVWGRLGYATQNQAFDEGAEARKGQFAPFTVNSYTEQVAEIYGKMMEQWETPGQEPELRDRMLGIALLKRAQIGGWTGDDTHIGFWKDENSKTHKFLKGVLGIKNDNTTQSSVRDIMMMIATGGKTDFVRDNVVISEFKDFATKDLKDEEGRGMSEDVFYNAIENGFNDDALAKKYTHNGEQIQNAKQLQDKLKEYLASRLKADGRTSTEALDGVRDSIFAGGDNAKAIMDSHWQTVRESQTAFQVVAGVRGEQIKNGHPEIAGHAISTTVRGEQLAMPMGPRKAREYWLFEANKAPNNTRAQLTVHTQADVLTQTGDQIVLQRNAAGTSSALGSVTDHLIFKNMGDREKNAVLGVGGLTEKLESFTNNKGEYEFSALRDKNGEESALLKNWRREIEEQGTKAEKDFLESIKDDDATLRAWLTSKNLKHNTGVAIKNGGRNVFLMRIGQGGGLQLTDGYKGGKMNAVMVKANGESKHYSDYNRFVDDYNNGHFDFDSYQQNGAFTELAAGDRLTKLTIEKGGKEDDTEEDEEQPET